MAVTHFSINGGKASEPQPSPLQVLILENEPADAELCMRELKRAGLALRAKVAETRAEFEKELSSGVPDMVLADFNLPGWNGMAALEVLREKGLDSPLILVSGALGEEAAVECIKQGATDYVLKNNLTRLPFAVQRALEDRRIRDERTRAQTALRNEEERFRVLIDNSADGIALIDAQGKILFTSHANNHIVGYTAEEQVGKIVLGGIHPEDRPRVRTVFESIVCRPGSRVAIELRYRCKTGGWVWLECIANNLLNDPAVEGIVVNYRDISGHKEYERTIRALNDELEHRVEERTAQLEGVNRDLQSEIAERRRTEQTLRRSQERFRLLVDGVRDYAIFMLDAAGCIRSWNPGAERITGFRAPEVLGRHYSCIYTAEDMKAARPRSILERTEREGRFEEEGWRARKDGSRFLASVLVAALFGTDGKLRGFSHIIRDVTERHKTQQAIENLRLQQAMILKAVGEGICGLDRDGRCTFFNPAAERMTGWHGQGLIGLDARMMDVLVPHRRADGSSYPVSECRIQKTLTEGVTSQADDEMFRRKDGTLFPVDYISTPVRDPQGEIQGAVISFQDITGRRAIERMKDEFVSIVGHELRTPLTSIRATLGLLAAGLLDRSPEKRRQMREIALTSTERLVRILNDILDLERLQSGQALIARVECDAGNLVTQAAEAMRVLSEKHAIRLELSSPPVTFRADPDRVLQVLTNLLSNAVKFSYPGTVVTVAAHKEEDQVVFSVQDRGRGIPPDKLETIFERFRQVDASDSRDKGGTGLGLAICRSIAKQHGGRIWVESELGSGSVFYFSLPVGEAPAPDGRVESV